MAYYIVQLKYSPTDVDHAAVSADNAKQAKAYVEYKIGQGLEKPKRLSARKVSVEAAERCVDGGGFDWM